MSFRPRLNSVSLCVLTVLASIAIHEAGHALAAGITGGKVSGVSFSWSGPSVHIQGAASSLGKAVRAGAGSALFLLAWLAVLVIPPIPRLVSHVSSLVALKEGCGWFLSAVLYPFGPASEDSWKFLHALGMPPLLLAAVILLLGLGGYRLFRLTDHRRRSRFPKLLPLRAMSAAAAHSGTSYSTKG